VTSIDLEQFDQVWCHDFEFVAPPGERPRVVCLSAYELHSGRTLNLWHNELNEQPPYRTDGKVLFVSFVANAEIACHLALGWPVPANILDLSPVFRNLISGRTSLDGINFGPDGRATPDGKSLIGMMRYFGLDPISSKRKDAMRDRIMRGWPFTPAERERILSYCAGDVEALVQLLPRVIPGIDLGTALYWGKFVAASAAMQHRGVPIDMAIYPQLADKNIWRNIRDDMVPAIDAQYGVFVRNLVGDWTFSMDRWDAYLKREGLHDLWPNTTVAFYAGF